MNLSNRFTGATILVAALWASASGAPPPVGDFPAVLAPDGITAPKNTMLWAFGRSAPSLDQIGFVASVAGTPLAMTPTSFGCCAVIARPAFVAATTVDVLVTTAGAERTARFLVGARDDTTAPTLTLAGLIDSRGGGLVIGAEGNDDTGLAGFIARVGDRVTAGPVDAALVVSDARCAAVVAVDLAGNESAAREVCAPDEQTDAGPDPVDGGPDPVDGGPDDGGDVEGGGCTAADTRLGVFPLALLLFLRRRSPR